VVIHSEDWDSHLLLPQAVLVSLEATGLTANPKKCCLTNLIKKNLPNCGVWKDETSSC
jgi:hypothetical protein